MDDNGNCSLYLKHMNCDPRTLFVILKLRAGTEYGKFEGYILVYGATLYSAILDSPAVTVTADQYEAAPVNTVVKTSIDLDDLYNSNTRACHKSNKMSNLGKDILSILEQFPEARVPVYSAYTRGLSSTNFTESRATLRLVRFWSQHILEEGDYKGLERRLVILHPEHSISDATMITYDTAISVQFKCGKFDMSSMACFCSHVKRGHYRAGSIDCIVISFSSCPGAGSQHLILPAVDFLKEHDDGVRYFDVPNWIQVPVKVLYDAEEGDLLSTMQPSKWFSDLCTHMQLPEVPVLKSNREPYVEERITQFWANYYVDLAV